MKLLPVGLAEIIAGRLKGKRVFMVCFFVKKLLDPENWGVVFFGVLCFRKIRCLKNHDVSGVVRKHFVSNGSKRVGGISNFSLFSEKGLLETNMRIDIKQSLLRLLDF